MNYTPSFSQRRAVSEISNQVKQNNGSLTN